MRRITDTLDYIMLDRTAFPVEPDLSNIRATLKEARDAATRAEYAAVIQLGQDVLAELERFSPGAARDALQDQAYRLLLGALYRFGQFDEMRQRIAEWQARTRSPQALVDAQVELARVTSREGDHTTALQLLDEATSRAEAADYLRGLGSASRERANVLWTLGQSDRSIIQAQQALTIFEQLNDTQEQARSHNTLALALQHTGAFYQALQHERRAILLLEQLSDRFALAIVYSNIGEIYQQLNDMPHALEYHQRAMDLIGEGASPDLRRNLGVDLIGLGDYDAGMAHLRAALEQAQAIGDQDTAHQAMYSLADAYYVQGNYAEAERLAAELLAEAERISSIRLRIRASLLLGYCARQFQNTEQAHEFFHEAFMAAQHAADKHIIWQAHAALAGLLAASQPPIAAVHRTIAREMLRSIVLGIEDKDLRACFRQHPRVHDLLGDVDDSDL